jgi:D-alanyl-D-alanine carboxypeptidase
MTSRKAGLAAASLVGRTMSVIAATLLAGTVLGPGMAQAAGPASGAALSSSRDSVSTCPPAAIAEALASVPTRNIHSPSARFVAAAAAAVVYEPNSGRLAETRPSATEPDSASASASASASVAVAVATPLPSCKGIYKDVVTGHTTYADWQLTLVDTIYRVPSNYYPPDLTGTGLPGGGQIRSLAKPDLTLMARAAAAAGAPLQVVSAFRSYSTQISTFNYWTRVSGLAAALTASARPGHSEHQLGLAVDFTTRGGSAPWLYADWAKTKSGAWVIANAWKYGWVLSYPKATSPTVTCYIYEPWHFRYVGRDEAAAIHASSLTTREWLWAHQ